MKMLEKYDQHMGQNTMSSTTIIGISGISGAGKSTLTKALANYLKVSSLYWDDFDTISLSPDDYVNWFERSRDYTEFNYGALAQSLFELKNGKTITHPVTQERIAPTEYIIVDAPLGKAHEQTARYIDIFIHIDIPLDIALARRLLREIKHNNINIKDIIKSLNQYLNKSRVLFDTDSIQSISNTANYTVDGMIKIEDQIKAILAFVNATGTGDSQ